VILDRGTVRIVVLFISVRYCYYQQASLW